MRATRPAASAASAISVQPLRAATGLAVRGLPPVRSTGQFVELVVEDDGHGMSPGGHRADLRAVLHSTKETGKGSGMGLAMVHGIVHEHGGHVVVESAPGAGARFRVVWPVATDLERRDRRDRARASRPGRRGPSLEGSVLVVDDEEAVGEFMRELLETWGLRATCTPRARGGARTRARGAAPTSTW